MKKAMLIASLLFLMSCAPEQYQTKITCFDQTGDEVASDCSDEWDENYGIIGLQYSFYGKTE